VDQVKDKFLSLVLLARNFTILISSSSSNICSREEALVEKVTSCTSSK